MRAAPSDLPIGIVFRRLHTDVERAKAQSLLGAGASPDEVWIWFGLWDLAEALEGTGLLGAAAVRPAAPLVAELCAWTVRDPRAWWIVGDRLLRGVADAMRAEGTERMIATRKRRDEEEELLDHLGFRSAGAQDADGDATGWLSLEL
jgi:hypothetical protein